MSGRLFKIAGRHLIAERPTRHGRRLHLMTSPSFETAPADARRIIAGTHALKAAIVVSSKPELSLMIFHRRKAHIFRRAFGSL